MIKAKTRPNIRYFEDKDSGINFNSQVPQTIKDNDLKSYAIKAALFNGDIIITEGELLMNYKTCKLYVSAITYPYMYGHEFALQESKFFRKNLLDNTIIWEADIRDGDISTEIKNILLGVTQIVSIAEQLEIIKPIINESQNTSVIIEQPIINTEVSGDLNNDGIIDNKDYNIASNVLNKAKKNKKSRTH